MTMVAPGFMLQCSRVGENRYEDAGDALLDDEEVRQQFLGG